MVKIIRIILYYARDRISFSPKFSGSLVTLLSSHMRSTHALRMAPCITKQLYSSSGSPGEPQTAFRHHLAVARPCHITPPLRISRTSGTCVKMHGIIHFALTPTLSLPHVQNVCARKACRERKLIPRAVQARLCHQGLRWQSYEASPWTVACRLRTCKLE